MPRLTMFLLPIEPDYEAQISLRWPMTQHQWDRMQTVLEAMKPALVRETETVSEAKDCAECDD